MSTMSLKATTPNGTHLFKGLRITFDIKKSIFGGLNSGEISIYNIDADRIQLFSKDVTDNTKIDVILQIQNNYKITNLFHGRVFKGITTRDGVDLKTTINCYDGLDAVTKDYTGNSASKFTAFLKLCKEAGLTSGISHFNNSLQKIAHHGQILEQLLKLDPSRIFFIENNTAHFIEKSKGVIAGFSPLIQKDQLVGFPNKTNNYINFETLQNDYIHIGGLLLLRGFYGGAMRVESIEITGDNFGDFLKQKVKCQFIL